jgi:hypothetical protein
MCNVKTFCSIPLICIQQFGEFLSKYLTKPSGINFTSIRTEESNSSVHPFKTEGRKILSDLVTILSFHRIRNGAFDSLDTRFGFLRHKTRFYLNV